MIRPDGSEKGRKPSDDEQFARDMRKVQELRSQMLQSPRMREPASADERHS
jgi:hypothetical protein